MIILTILETSLRSANILHKPISALNLITTLLTTLGAEFAMTDLKIAKTYLKNAESENE